MTKACKICPFVLFNLLQKNFVKITTNMKKQLLVILAVFIALSMFAQYPGGQGNRQFYSKIFSQLQPGKGVIIGRVVSTDGKGMAYTTVTLYRQSDSSIVSGVLTDTTGRFALLNVPMGKYFMEVKFIGFRKKIIKDITVSKKQRFVKIGKIMLKEQAQQLDQVVVTAQSKDIEYRVDKKVINVSKNIATAGGTAVDLLQNVPSVQVDIQGNVTLRGSSNFTVFINGKPSVLEGSEALQQIPASEVQRIEIITNPSAKYDPDGVAGIINIITKQPHERGYNGNISITYDNYNSLRANAIFNIRFKKINYFIGFTKNDRIRPADYISKRIISHDSMKTVFESNGTNVFHRGGWTAKTGFNYYLNDKTTLTLSGNIGQRKFNFSSQSFFNQYVTLNQSKLYNVFYKQSGVADAQGWMYRADIDLLHKFDNNGHQLHAYAFVSNWMPTRLNQTTVDTTDQDWNIISQTQFGQKSSEQRSGFKSRFQVDYDRPLSNGRKIETGLSLRYNKVTSDYRFYQKDGSDQWQELTDRANYMIFNRLISAAYFTYTGKLKDILNYQVGLRTEYVNRLINQTATGEQDRVDRVDLFPSLNISKRFGRTFQMQLGYSRRVHRPNGWYLNPFPIYVDQYTVMRGNPALLPEFANSYEFNMIKNFKSGYFSVETFYRKTLNKFQRIRTVADSNVIVNTWTNAGQDIATGAELSFNYFLMRMLMFNASTSVYYYQLMGTLNNQDVNTADWTWNSRLMLMAMLPTFTRLQIMGFYRAPIVTLQGYSKGMFFSSIGLRQDLFKRKLSITLTVWDPFKLAKFESVTDVQDLYVFSEYIMKSPQVSLTLSLRINDYRPQQNMKQQQEDVSEFEGEGLY